MKRHSPTEIASGFSQYTCKPWLSTLVMPARCNECGVAITTASTAPLAHISSMSANCFASDAICPARSSAFGHTSQTAVSSAPGSFWNASTWNAPIPATPATPTRTLTVRSRYLVLLQLDQTTSFIALLIEGIERVTAGDEPVARRGRAVTESSAKHPAVRPLPIEHISREGRIGEHHASESDHGRSTARD